MTSNAQGNGTAHGDADPDAAVSTPETATRERAAHAMATPDKATLDEATLAELYRLHGGYLLRALMRITNGDRGRAEDILQETLVRAWRNPGAIARGPASCRPWLFTVARRIAIDHFRMVAARPAEISDESPEDRTPAYDPYDDVLAACDLEVVLAKLPAHHRAVVVELHLNGRSVVDAARVLGIPVGTVKSRNYYAVRALRPMLEAAGLRVAA
ncbi:sigma-70 family RNA polymerase sigma factor [Actinoallomurus bryophytorum]|uniref:RNA polymerase sigma factor n=1 Tax=Actinoallomurus bryophytorum TaxID=1490222 RepID=A0A543CTJ1_9ACTN|nr:sigma-70 family RNA polymerase sigma factor [Actinoallomurus bryophytorum]TQM00417.1 RNA polymerase sigma-70 factor (ECF subfamily) [Actinoallomurus bryophytorum]